MVTTLESASVIAQKIAEAKAVQQNERTVREEGLAPVLRRARKVREQVEALRTEHDEVLNSLRGLDRGALRSYNNEAVERLANQLWRKVEALVLWFNNCPLEMNELPARARRIEMEASTGPVSALALENGIKEAVAQAEEMARSVPDMMKVIGLLAGELAARLARLDTPVRMTPIILADKPKDEPTVVTIGPLEEAFGLGVRDAT